MNIYIYMKRNIPYFILSLFFSKKETIYSIYIAKLKIQTYKM